MTAFRMDDACWGALPLNVAWALKGFGLDPLFVSAVGEDADGETIRSKMQSWGMSTAGLQTNFAHATGEVHIQLEQGDATYEICAPRAWDAITDESLVASGWIYHGLLALRSAQTRETFEQLIKRSSAKRFFDVNLRPPYDDFDLLKHWIHGVDWLKLNDDELAKLLGQDSIDFEDCEDAVHSLRADYQIANVLLTGGSHGARIIGEFGSACVMPAPKPESMVDTVGAGDSFAACMLYGILTGQTSEQTIRRASQFASKICGMHGATCATPDFYR